MHGVSCSSCEFSVPGFREVKLGLGIRKSLGSTLTGIKGVPSDAFPVPGRVLDEHCGATRSTLFLLGGKGELMERTEKRSGAGSGEWEVGAGICSTSQAGAGEGGWEHPEPGDVEWGWGRAVGDVGDTESERAEPAKIEIVAHKADTAKNKPLNSSSEGKREARLANTAGYKLGTAI